MYSTADLLSGLVEDSFLPFFRLLELFFLAMDSLLRSDRPLGRLPVYRQIARQSPGGGVAKRDCRKIRRMPSATGRERKTWGRERVE